MDLNEIWCIKMIWKLLSFIGINPSSKLNKRNKLILSIIQILFILFCPFYYSLSGLIYPIVAGNKIIIFENVPLVLTSLLQCYKLFIVFKYRFQLQNIRKLLLLLQDKINDEDEINYLKKIIKNCNQIFKFITLMLIFGMCFKEISTQFNTDNKKAYYYVWNPEIISSTNIGWYFRNFHCRISMFFYFLAFMIVETINPIYLFILTGHFHVLLIKIEKISKNSNKTSYDELLECIKYHKVLQRIFKINDKVVNRQQLIQYIISACLLAVVSISAGIFKDLYFELIVLIFTQVAFILQIFLTSYFADMLKNESEKLTNALFSCNWIERNKKFRKTLIIFMQRSQKSFEINAGWLPVTLQSFARVLNFAYSAFLLLKHMRDNGKM